MLFAINLVFTQRIIRAQHPAVGWSRPASIFFPLCYAWIVVSIAAIIVVAVQTNYTLSGNTQRIDRDILLYGQTAFAVIAFLPIPLLTISTLAGRLSSVQARRAANGGSIDKFGHGSMRVKIVVVMLSALLLCLGASYRVGVNFLTPIPLAAAKPWYFSKACFYCFNFVIEILVVYAWLAVRIDQRFHIPNKSSGAYNYAAYLATRSGAVPDAEKNVSGTDSESELQAGRKEEDAPVS